MVKWPFQRPHLLLTCGLADPAHGGQRTKPLRQGDAPLKGRAPAPHSGRDTWVVCLCDTAPRGVGSLCDGVKGSGHGGTRVGEVREWDLETQGDVGGLGDTGIRNTGTRVSAMAQWVKDLACLYGGVHSIPGLVCLGHSSGSDSVPGLCTCICCGCSH